MELIISQDVAADGALLMLRDTRDMELCGRGEIPASLRFYEWDQPTLSLGYHQRLDTIDGDLLQKLEIPWVRRPTGGAAVLHSEELTYAIVLPDTGTPGYASLMQEYVSRSLARGLRAMGVDADVDARGEPLASLANRASCFVRTSRWEVTVGGKKIVGSAQRKWEGSILQHGSILIGDDHLRIVDVLKMESESSRESLRERLRSHSTCVRRELGREIELRDLRIAMADAFSHEFREFPSIAETAKNRISA